MHMSSAIKTLATWDSVTCILGEYFLTKGGLQELVMFSLIINISLEQLDSV